MSSTMLAAVYKSTSGGMEKNLTIEEAAPRPPPLKDGETLVKVAYASLNPADYKLVEIPLAGNLFAKPPATPSFDYSGRVVETKNPAVKPGQLVFGRLDGPSKYGCAAEYTVAPKAGTIPLPDNVNLATGAAIGTAAISAWQSIAPSLKAKPAGTRVLVNGGSGGTGVWGIQFAKALGAKVTATSSAANAALCKELGADETIDYRSTDVSKTLSEQAQIDPSKRYDLVFDAIGSPADLYSAGNNFMKLDGHFRQIGAGTGFGDAASIASRMGRPSFLGGGSRSYKFLSAANSEADFTEMARICADGQAKAVIDSTWKLAETMKAYEKLRTGRAKGKILIEVAGESV